MRFQYKVIPAPTRGLKSRGIKGSGARFAHGIESKLNELALEGWEYIRAETLPAEEREGLMSKTTVFQNLLVFRKPIAAEPVEDLGGDAQEVHEQEDHEQEPTAITADNLDSEASEDALEDGHKNAPGDR